MLQTGHCRGRFLEAKRDMRSPVHRVATATAAATIACATIGGISHQSSAAIRIIKGNGDPVPDSAYTIVFNAKAGGYDITLLDRYNPGLDSVFDIRASAGEYINSLVIDVDGPAAGSPIIVKAQGEAPGFMLGVGTIVETGTGETILNKVQVTQDIGSVTVEAIGDLLAGRDIVGPITATTSNSTVRGMTNVFADRDILGDCTADNGRIVFVWAQRHIGTQSDPVLIRAKHNIYQVMGDDVFADIMTRHNGSTGGFFALVANRFSGTLVTERFIANPWSGIDGLVEIYNQFDGVISIGKNFTSPAQYIQTPAHGLGGQIIVNADGVAGGLWTSPVRVGPNGHPQQVILNSPGYSQTASQLGGGSVGLVPFKLHDESCQPTNGATVQLAPNAPPFSVELRHYGPVNWSGASPVTIERRPAATQNPFTALPLSNFALSRSSGNRSIMISSIEGLPGFQPGWQYRIRPTAQLLCDISTAPPAVSPAPGVAWDGDYLLTIHLPPCDGDVIPDGFVNINDLLSVINFWGVTNPVFPAPDIDQDGFVNINDLLIVINHWGPCW